MSINYLPYESGSYLEILKAIEKSYVSKQTDRYVPGTKSFDFTSQ
jgi:hypothetical protein